MWLVTENPWPLILVFAGVAVLLLINWYSRRKRILLPIAGLMAGLAVASWAVDHWIVTDREQLEATVYELRDAVQGKDLPAVVGFFTELKDKLAVTAGLSLVEFEDSIRVTALEAEMLVPGTRGKTRFRANVSLKVKTQGSVGRQPTMWELTWEKQVETSQWRIVEVQRLHPLTHEPIRVMPEASRLF